ncbi:MAG TPA: glycoside hydrolase family 38 C-terminal domain-containing protein, partial [Microbacterium sp.]|nr:glycoside hydrolase family 38 C-terminal domain-containing protein [Microbacterium sp.]
EHALIEAELWAATDGVRTGAAYPQEEFDRLWQIVLLHEFHDILPGTSIAWVHREAVEVLTNVLSDAEDIAGAARRSLAGEGDRELLFVPTSVGARGRALGAAFTDETPAAASVSLVEEDGGWRLENELVSVLVSPDGLIVSAVDKATGREAVAEGRAANLFQLHQDFPNMWDAWDIDKYYRNSVDDLTAVSSIEASVVGTTAVVKVTRPFSQSTIEQTIVLAPGSRTVLLRNEIDWHETEKLLKLAFPLDIQASHTEAETQFGYQARATHTNTSWEAAKFETSMHRFVLVREADFGVALVNDSIYGYDTSRDVQGDAVTTTVRLSLLRAPRFPDPDTDHGHHAIEVGFVIGADAGIATAEGITLNATPTVLRGAREVDPLVSVVGQGIVVSAVKLADDGSGDVIVRVYESLGRRASGALEVDFPHREVREVSLIEDELAEPRLGGELKLRPFEVRTLRIAR